MTATALPRVSFFRAQLILYLAALDLYASPFLKLGLVYFPLGGCLVLLNGCWVGGICPWLLLPTDVFCLHCCRALTTPVLLLTGRARAIPALSRLE